MNTAQESHARAYVSLTLAKDKYASKYPEVIKSINKLISEQAELGKFEVLVSVPSEQSNVLVSLLEDLGYKVYVSHYGVSVVYLEISWK